MKYEGIMLTDREQYLRLLSALEKDAVTTEIVRICDVRAETPLIKSAKRFLI